MRLSLSSYIDQKIPNGYFFVVETLFGEISSLEKLLCLQLLSDVIAQNLHLVCLQTLVVMKKNVNIEISHDNTNMMDDHINMFSRELNIRMCNLSACYLHINHTVLDNIILSVIYSDNVPFNFSVKSL